MSRPLTSAFPAYDTVLRTCLIDLGPDLWLPLWPVLRLTNIDMVCGGEDYPLLLWIIN